MCERSVLVCIDVLKQLKPVDDSDGMVGDAMMQVVELLNMFAAEKPELRP